MVALSLFYQYHSVYYFQEIVVHLSGDQEDKANNTEPETVDNDDEVESENGEIELNQEQIEAEGILEEEQADR